VPDAGRYIRAYARHDSEFFEAMRELGGAAVPFETDIEIVNQAFRMGGDHHRVGHPGDATPPRGRGFRGVEETGYDPVRFIDRATSGVAENRSTSRPTSPARRIKQRIKGSEPLNPRSSERQRSRIQGL
jgi:hypothetical protein